MTRGVLGFASHSAGYVVSKLVMDAFDVVQRAQENIEEFGVEMFPTMFAHEIDGVLEGEGRLVDPLCGEGIEGIGDRGDSSF